MIANAKKLDLHQNEVGILCTVSETGQLIPYDPQSAKTIVSDKSAPIVLELPVLELPDLPEPTEQVAPPLMFSPLEITSMGWRKIKTYCAENGFLDKPENESWEDYLTRSLYPEDSNNG